MVPQDFSIGQVAMPAGVEVNGAGEIAISEAGRRVLERGKFFISPNGAIQRLEQLAMVAARRVALPQERHLLPVPLPPTDQDFAVEIEVGSNAPGEKPVRFLVQGWNISLLGDPPQAKALWFTAKVIWGQDPWLVDLGDWPQGRASRRAKLTQSSMVSLTPPGFTSAPRNPRIFQVASGAVSNLNFNAIYDQARDRTIIFSGPHVELAPERYEDRSAYTIKARLRSGDGLTQQDSKRTVLSISQRDSVIGSQVQFFRPMSEEMRTRFPAALSGWLSAYGGVRRVDTEEEFWKINWFSEHYEEAIIKAADWFRKNLQPDAYGPINIGVNDLHGMNGVTQQRFTLATPDLFDHHRDWRVQNAALFPHGAKWLADEIHKRGMQLGSWAIPDAWDADDLYNEHPDWFLHYPDGTPVYFGVWNGKYFLDGSNPEAVKFLREEMRRYTQEWGIDNWWVDGNWSDAMERIASATPFFYDRTVPWWEAHRRLIQAIRDGAGPNSYIDMDGPIPLTAMGIANGSRTANDPNGSTPEVGKYGEGECCQDWNSAFTARTGTMDWYFLNRTGWYCDPSDAFNVGYPLTVDQAHVWGPMISLTGQVLMLGDRVYELEPDRVAIAKALFPSPPVRPVELYSRHGQQPEVWDLRVGHVGQQWDVVMFVNWQTQPRTIAVTLEDLGMKSSDKYLLFDFWQKKSLGVVSDGRIELPVPATGSRLVRLTPLEDHPELFGLARHITQGLVDLRALGWEAQKRILSGMSVVPGGDPYQFWVYVPEGFSFQSVRSSAGTARCEHTSRGVLTCSILTPNIAQVKWALQF
jgi:hypothetical protein